MQMHAKACAPPLVCNIIRKKFEMQISLSLEYSTGWSAKTAHQELVIIHVPVSMCAHFILLASPRARQLLWQTGSRTAHHPSCTTAPAHMCMPGVHPCLQFLFASTNAQPGTRYTASEKQDSKCFSCLASCLSLGNFLGDGNYPNCITCFFKCNGEVYIYHYYNTKQLFQESLKDHQDLVLFVFQ